jgi:hypothetical protein
VLALFGPAVPGAPQLSLQLTAHRTLRHLRPLRSTKQPLVAFAGVGAGGKRAIFTIVGAVILRGGAKCIPSASRCHAIGLEPAQSEDLEYLPASGQAVTYRLKVVSISSTRAASASARRARAAARRRAQAARHRALAALRRAQAASRRAEAEASRQRAG